MKQKKSGMFKYYLKEASKCWQLYVLLIPALLWAVIFAYYPMYGVIIAFKDYKIGKVSWEAPGQPRCFGILRSSSVPVLP